MQTRSNDYASIIEKARDRIAEEDEARRKEEEDRFYKFNLSGAYRDIQDWKRRFLKKNCKRRATIRVYRETPFIDGQWVTKFQRNVLQLFIDGTLKSETHITPEAYDTLARGLEVETISGVDYVYLGRFIPLKSRS